VHSLERLFAELDRGGVTLAVCSFNSASAIKRALEMRTV
jgi:hypothetical protein